jgi:hypothetical protein
MAAGPSPNCVITCCMEPPGSKCCYLCQLQPCPEHITRVRLVANRGTTNAVYVCKKCYAEEETWRKDDTTQTCFECSRAFNVVRRRHHCRFCGNIFCSACSKFQRTAHVVHPTVKEVRLRCCLPCAFGERRERSATILHSIRESRTPAAIDRVFCKEENCTYTSDFFERFCRARDMSTTQRGCDNRGNSRGNSRGASREASPMSSETRFSPA